MRFQFRDIFDLLFTNLTGAPRSAATSIITEHAAYAGFGGGIAPVILDVAVVTGLQMNMMKNLCDEYEVEYSRNITRSALTALAGGSLAGASSGLKLIPFVGPFVGGFSVGIGAGATTYAIGKVFADHFEAGGTMENFEVGVWRRAFEEQYAKAKVVFEKVQDYMRAREESRRRREEKSRAKQNGSRPEPEEPEVEPAFDPMEDLRERLDRLRKLRDDGLITEEEFEAKKKAILEDA